MKPPVGWLKNKLGEVVVTPSDWDRYKAPGECSLGAPSLAIQIQTLDRS